MDTVFNDALKAFVRTRVTLAEVAAEADDRCKELIHADGLAYSKLEPLLIQGGGMKLFEEAQDRSRDLWDEFCNASYMQGFRDAMRILSGA